MREYSIARLKMPMERAFSANDVSGADISINRDTGVGHAIYVTNSGIFNTNL
jgi:hypothetical protein